MPSAPSKETVVKVVGKSLGHYNILEPLGAGGMGEVYRARDTKLDRDVAIKVLPPDFAADPERLARFEREAKLLASLNHQNIAAIYGLEDEGDQRFIAMELVEGETLAERLAQGGRIPVHETMDIARQIARALEAAHENSVIHRDLKPANVIITDGGMAKVLDFGLAKSYEVEGAASGVSPQISNSPTMMEATRAGMILGTAAYMSPEQAKGNPVDKRADIWSFGALVFEMLTAQTAFRGEDVSETLAAILKDEPNWAALPGDASLALDSLLRRCLTKNADQRLHDIADARIEIDQAIDDPGDVLSQRFGEPLLLPLWRRALPWAVAVVSIAIALSSSYRLAGTGESMATSVVKLPLFAPPGHTFYERSVAISRDGKTIAAVTRSDDFGVWTRRLDETTWRPVEGAQQLGAVSGAAGMLVFSPEGDWVVYWSRGQFHRARLDGGPSFPITRADVPRGVAFLDDDTIVFQPSSGEVLHRVQVGGGEPEPVTMHRQGMTLHRFPQRLSDGRLLFTEGSNESLPSQWRIVIDEGEGEPTTMWERGTFGRYVPTGHLVFGRQSTLLAIPYDLESGSPIGAVAEPVVNTARVNDERVGGASYDFSDDGTLVYVPARDRLPSDVVLFGLDGSQESLALDPVYPTSRGALRVAPGEPLKFAVTEWDPVSDRRRVKVFQPGTGLPAITLPIEANSLAWSHDGSRLALHRPLGTGEGEILLLDRVASDAEPRSVVTTGISQLNLAGFSEDGRKLVYDSWMPGGGWVLMEVDLESTETRTLVERGNSPRFSHDRRLLSYSKYAAPGLFVRSYSPDGIVGPEVQVAEQRSGSAWSPNEQTLYFVEGNAANGRVMAVEIDGESGEPLSRPTAVFPRAGFRGGEVMPDGSGFIGLMPIDDPDQEPWHLMVIVNWFEELKRLVPPGGS